MRVVAIVIDSGGVGALADADAYGDAPGADTIGNVARRLGSLALPNLERLGLGSLTQIPGVAPVANPEASVARLRERSRGKDTITGHWEMMGVVTQVPFPTYPEGFPPEVIERFTQITGKLPLGNVPASGTEIIEQLGAAHMESGRPILYTSADSVFQIAAHEEIVPLMCSWSGAPGPARCSGPAQRQPGHRPPLPGATGGFLADAESPGLCNRATPQLAGRAQSGGYRGACSRKDFGHLLRTRDCHIRPCCRQPRSNGEDVRVARTS